MNSDHEHKKRLYTRDLTLIALFSAVYVAYSEMSSLTIGGATHGVDTLFIRSTVFVVLAVSTSKFGPSTLMGAVSGAILTFTVPTPLPIYLFPALLLYGLTYDLYMHLMGFSTSTMKAKHVAMATILSSATMSFTALSVLTWTGFLPVNGLALIWTFGVLRDIAVGLIGSYLGLEIAKHAIDVQVKQ